MPSLERLQSWMVERITGAPEPDAVAPPLKDNPALPAARGLAVYRHAYRERLLECMGKEYPVLKETLGDEMFAGFACEYLRAYPPRSPSLADLGDRFARHLAETRPSKPEGGAADWTDLIIDLAALERAFSVAFDAPSEALPLRLTCAYPVQRYFQAVRRGDAGELPTEADETPLELDRVGDRVRIRVSRG